MIEIILTLVMTHITILCVTIYLHRHQTHLALELSQVHQAMNVVADDLTLVSA